MSIHPSEIHRFYRIVAVSKGEYTTLYKIEGISRLMTAAEIKRYEDRGYQYFIASSDLGHADVNAWSLGEKWFLRTSPGGPCLSDLPHYPLPWHLDSDFNKPFTLAIHPAVRRKIQQWAEISKTEALFPRLPYTPTTYGGYDWY